LITEPESSAYFREDFMRWLLLSLGILTEVCGSTCMKLSNGFSNIYASILTFVFWGISFSIFIIALRYFDLSFAYAIWAGLGILLVSVVGMVYFKEPATMMKVFSILIIVVGVVMLNLSELTTNQPE
jgi:small multidrug resistance pump